MSKGFFPHIISNNHSVNRLSNNTEYFLFPNSFVLLVIIPYSNYVWKVESFSVMRTHCGFSFIAVQKGRETVLLLIRLMMMVVMMATVHVPRNTMHALEAKPVCKGCLGTLHNQNPKHVCW